MYSRAVGRRVQEGDELSEGPCVMEAELREIQRETGRPCPRVELHQANSEALQLVRVMLNEMTRPAYPVFASDVLDGCSADVRASIQRRAFTTLNDSDVVAKLYPKPKAQPAQPRRPAPRRR